MNKIKLLYNILGSKKCMTKNEAVINLYVTKLYLLNKLFNFTHKSL